MTLYQTGSNAPACHDKSSDNRAANPTVSGRYYIESQDIKILAAIEDGLPLVSRPFKHIGSMLSLSEEEVLFRLRSMVDMGIIRRFGMVLQHRSLGYRANAMVVFDVPDSALDDIAECIISHNFVTLCYARHRQLPQWSYNLYCMIHGQKRSKVEDQIITLKQDTGLEHYPSEVLFSIRCFKQTGARFSCAVADQKRGIIKDLRGLECHDR